MDNTQESQAIELEKKLLAAMLTDDGESIAKVNALVSEEDFYRPEHRLVYKVMTQLSARGVPVNYAVILSELNVKSRQDGQDLTRFVIHLAENEYTAARATWYAEEIKKLSKYRQLAQLGRELTDEASHDRKAPEEIMSYADKRLREIEGARTGEIKSITESAQEIFDGLGKARELPLSTGFIDLDNLTGGLKKSELIILAARPSMGKTALALNIAQAAARQSTVLLCSLEMSTRQLGTRLLSSISSIPAEKIERDELEAEEYHSLASALAEISSLKFYTDDTAALSLFKLRSLADSFKRARGLDLLVIDYLQLMSGSLKENRTQEVSELSRGLKILAKELDIPVLVLSQLNRNVEQRGDKRPLLADLRESGAIEQDADIVMFLYREEYYFAGEAENIAEVIVAKNRDGATGVCRLQFEKTIMQFRNLYREEF